jgi:hypothetical protein
MFNKDEDKNPYVKAIMHTSNIFTVGELLSKTIEFLKDQAEKFSPGITEASGSRENKDGVVHWDDESKSWKTAYPNNSHF